MAKPPKRTTRSEGPDRNSRRDNNKILNKLKNRKLKQMKTRTATAAQKSCANGSVTLKKIQRRGKKRKSRTEGESSKKPRTDIPPTTCSEDTSQSSTDDSSDEKRVKIEENTPKLCNEGSTSGGERRKVTITSPLSSPVKEEVTEEEMEEWKEIVLETYQDIREDYDKSVDESADDLFSANANKVKQHLERRSMKTYKPTKLNLDNASVPPRTARYCLSKAVEKKGKSGGRTEIRLLPSVKQLPAMHAWLQTSQNFAVEDQRSLSHIPIDTEADQQFVQELMAHYDFHVHGTGEGGFLNDTMLFKLVRTLTQTYKKLNDIQESTEKTVKTEVPDMVLRAVAAIFPDKGTFRTLKNEKYPDLLERYCPDESAVGMAEYMTPSMDGPKAISTTRERALHTFTSLWCSRCYMYDCFLHGPDNYPPQHIKKKKEDMQEYRTVFSLSPCSPTCYLHQQDILPHTDENLDKKKEIALFRSFSEGSSPRKRKGSPRNIFDTLDVSTTEVSMFRVYRGMYGDDYCAIAEGLHTLGSKTCTQVRDFASKEGPVSPNSVCMSPASAKSGKKLKGATHDAHHRFRRMKWASEDDTGQISNRFPYTPCAHPPGESCSPEKCDCAGRQVLCMKFCKCSTNCSNRFPGCRCKAHCNTRQCPCFMAYRECDPDLCTSCGAADLCAKDINCSNVGLQRRWGKQLLLAPSDISGWGVFLREAVPKNGFVSEYCGELITQEEADRRGKIYDRRKCSYLFNLNQEQAVDATRKGNKIRFANHSVNPNCYAKVLMVNGDHRIGIFAKESVQAGEELFFDYRYRPGDKVRFVSIERASGRW